MSDDFICIPSACGLILEETAAFVSDTERARERAEQRKCKIENKEEEENGWENVWGFFFPLFFARRMIAVSMPKQTALSQYMPFLCSTFL